MDRVTRRLIKDNMRTVPMRLRRCSVRQCVLTAHHESREKKPHKF